MDMSTANLDIMQFFVSMLIVGIGVALLATGMFTAYFGAGKSQKIGFALLFLGAITLALVIDMAFGTIGVMPDQFAKTNDDDDLLFTDALISGVSNKEAAKFSFLLAIPAILGAITVTAIDIRYEFDSTIWLPIAITSVTAFISGYYAYVES